MSHFLPQSLCNDAIMCYLKVTIDLRIKKVILTVYLRMAWCMLVNNSIEKE